MASPFPPPQAPTQTCYRHPDQVAGVICQRCDRPICPHCMNQASVGFHCPECAKKGSQKVYRGVAALTTRPVLTQVLIAVNVAVFVLGVIVSGASAVQGSSTLNIDGGLIARGLLVNGDLIGVAEGEWYRIVTSGFLHYGLFHIGMNMYALWILGNMLEGAVGRVRFGLIYAVALVGGSLGALLVSPNDLTAGASGAIFGLMGATLAIGRSRGINIRQSPVFGILMLNLLLTFALAGRLSVGGHIGGLVGGFIAGFLLTELPSRIRSGAPGARPAGVSPTADSGQVVAIAACVLFGAACVVGCIIVAGR